MRVVAAPLHLAQPLEAGHGTIEVAGRHLTVAEREQEAAELAKIQVGLGTLDLVRALGQHRAGRFALAGGLQRRGGAGQEMQRRGTAGRLEQRDRLLPKPGCRRWLMILRQPVHRIHGAGLDHRGVAGQQPEPGQFHIGRVGPCQPAALGATPDSKQHRQCDLRQRRLLGLRQVGKPPGGQPVGRQRHLPVLDQILRRHQQPEVAQPSRLAAHLFGQRRDHRLRHRHTEQRRRPQQRLPARPG